MWFAQDFLEKDGIDFSLVPLKIIVGDHEFIDDETLNAKELIAAMKAEKTATSSSLPIPWGFCGRTASKQRKLCDYHDFRLKWDL